MVMRPWRNNCKATRRASDECSRCRLDIGGAISETLGVAAHGFGLQLAGDHVLNLDVDVEMHPIREPAALQSAAGILPKQVIKWMHDHDCNDALSTVNPFK